MELRLEPFEQWVANRIEAPEFDPTLWFIVREGDEIAAVLRGKPELAGAGWVGALGVRPRWRKRGLGLALLHHAFGEFYRRGQPRVGLGVDARIPPVRRGSTSVPGCMSPTRRFVREGAFVSRLRAKCPDCKTFTAVAIGPEYECHSCGRVYLAGMVRVPQAWGDGGESMAEAAWLELPYPETAIIEAETLEEQNLALAADLPERPLILGGCCCSHVGAVEGLAARQDRLSVIWFDAHGDLNTAETSPSGNLWGMPLRKLIDSGAVDAGDVALVGARNLDPPEEVSSVEHGVQVGEEGIARALAGAACTYVAFDVDVLEPTELSVFMPEPGGLSVAEAERMLQELGNRDGGRRRGLHGRRLRAGRTSIPLAWLASAAACNGLAPASSKSSVPCPPGSTSPSSIGTSQSRRESSTRTHARSAPRTTGTTSSRRRSGCARTAGITSPCAPARGLRRSPTRARSSRRRPIFARRIRSTSSTCARTPSDSPRRR